MAVLLGYIADFCIRVSDPFSITVSRESSSGSGVGQRVGVGAENQTNLTF